MGKFLYAYKGGGMAATEEEQAMVMQAWQAWFGELGAAIVDGGSPFGGGTDQLLLEPRHLTLFILPAPIRRIMAHMAGQFWMERA